MRTADSPAQGSARIQHGVRKRREITGINRVKRTRDLATGLEGLAASLTGERLEKSQVSGPMPLLEQLAGHDYALDLVGALVDLGVVRRAWSRPARMLTIMWLTWR